MDEAQWKRIMDTDPSSITETQQTDLVNLLKRRTTFIKYKATGRTYSRLYYLVLSEDAIHYLGSKKKSKIEVCMIKDIEEVRSGFRTTVWRKCLKHGQINQRQVHLAFSILYNNNRQSLDLLAETEEIRSQWIQGLDFLINRYKSHIRTHREITDQWIRNSFSLADTDKSGQLNRAEIQRLLYVLNIQLDEDEIDLYVNQASIRSRNSSELKHLDKDEFLIFYKYVSQRPELLKIICQFNGSTSEQTAATFSEYSVIHRLSSLVVNPRKPHSLSFRKAKNPKNPSLPSSFRRRSASITPEQPSSSNAVEKRII